MGILWDTSTGRSGVGNVDKLRDRYWLGACGGLEIGLKLTETELGQFDAICHEPQTMPCDRHGPHLLLPATPQEYWAWCLESVDPDDFAVEDH